MPGTISSVMSTLLRQHPCSQNSDSQHLPTVSCHPLD